jgi:hypothetical protein
MSKMIKTLVLAAALAASASSSFAATVYHQGGLGAMYADAASTNQYTSREGLVEAH